MVVGSQADGGVECPPMPIIPRLPLIPDPLRRIELPHDLEAATSRGEEVEPAEVGLDREAVERIWKAARELYRSGVHPALQLCLRRHGKVFLNRSIGHARGNGPADRAAAPKVAVTPETPFCVFSASKGITAMLVHLLADRGLLDVDNRVVEYLPAYGAHGKEATTIAHVLSHRAGVPTLPKAHLELDSLADPEAIVGALCEARPFVKPGTLLAYHAVSGGFILGAIVERVTGRTIREVLAEEILDPLGFRWGNYGVAEDDVGRVGVSYATGAPLLPPLSLLATRVLSRPLEEVVEISNDPRFLTAILPAANIITTADELGRFFEIFRAGGELDGVQVMRPQTIRRALEQQSRLEFDLSLGFPTRFSLGLMLGAKVLSLFGLDTDSAFGHLGLINIMGWADPERGISGGLINSGKALLYPEAPRFYAVMQTIAASVPKVSASERLI
jgi:CubicO group peptidase (beta-lactamase class C family)